MTAKKECSKCLAWDRYEGNFDHTGCGCVEPPDPLQVTLDDALTILPKEGRAHRELQELRRRAGEERTENPANICTGTGLKCRFIRYDSWGARICPDCGKVQPLTHSRGL